MTSPLASAAADYLSRGLAIIALTGKTPNTAIHKRGLDQPLEGAVVTAEDAALVSSVFDHPETTGIGIVIRFPYVVVDIDGEDGAKQWVAMCPDALSPETWVAKTGRGLHLWFLSGAETGTIKLGPKLDLKGEGGYVAAPPSKHPDGHVYEWLRAPGEFLPIPAPAGLAEAISDHLYDRAGKMERKRVSAAQWGPKYQPGDTVFYAQASHDALIEGMKVAEEGNRNNYLHWAAATLAEENGSDDEFEQLAEAALAVGLDSDEVKATLRSTRRLHG